jgi:hypothetical protein
MLGDITFTYPAQRLLNTAETNKKPGMGRPVKTVSVWRAEPSRFPEYAEVTIDGRWIRKKEHDFGLDLASNNSSSLGKKKKNFDPYRGEP